MSAGIEMGVWRGIHRNISSVARKESELSTSCSDCGRCVDWDPGCLLLGSIRVADSSDYESERSEIAMVTRLGLLTMPELDQCLSKL